MLQNQKEHLIELFEDEVKCSTDVRATEILNELKNK